MLVALIMLVAAGPSLHGVVTRLDDPHSTIKAVLSCWHVVLLRGGLAPPLVIVTAVAAAVLAVLPGRRWLLVAPAVVAAAVLALPWSSTAALSVALLWLLANTAPLDAVRPARETLAVLGWVPGSLAALPLPMAAALLGPRWRRPAPRAVVAAVHGVAIALAWLVSDAGLARERYTEALYAWNTGRPDERIVVIEVAPPGHHGEYHELEIVGDHLFAVAEDSCRLLAVDLDRGTVSVSQLPERWPPLHAGVLDTYTDVDTGVTWALGGHGLLIGARFDGAAWSEAQRRTFDGPSNYMYLRPAPEIGRLLLVSVSGHDQEPGRIVSAVSPGMTDLTVQLLRTADGQSFSSPRDAVWVPPLRALALAPNFDRQLMLADPATGLVQPWVEVDATNGKLLWVPSLGRLLLAQPGRRVIAVIDPRAGIVERTIRTQPGVRTLAVDEGRGLLITASVITGRILIQRLDTGQRIGSIGTVMPMVREMVVDPQRGEVYLSTWTKLYRVDYLSGGGESTPSR